MQLRSIVEQFRRDQGREDVAVVVIGDSEADAKAAHNLGLFFIGFACCERKKERLQKAGLQALVCDFADLPDLVDWLRLPPQSFRPAKPSAPRP